MVGILTAAGALRSAVQVRLQLGVVFYVLLAKDKGLWDVGGLWGYWIVDCSVRYRPPAYNARDVGWWMMVDGRMPGGS